MRDLGRGRFRAGESAAVILFSKPGKATGWGIAGCLLCAVFAWLGLRWALGFTLITGLAGCLGRNGFDAPGRATGWAVAGCAACTAWPQAGAEGAVAFTVISALAGCWTG